MATCNVNTLLSSGKDFQKLSKRELQICICQLLCNISVSGSGGLGPYVGSGSPEGVVTAPPGAIYTDITASVVIAQYTKQTGTGNTGWI